MRHDENKALAIVGLASPLCPCRPHAVTFRQYSSRSLRSMICASGLMTGPAVATVSAVLRHANLTLTRDTLFECRRQRCFRQKRATRARKSLPASCQARRLSVCVWRFCIAMSRPTPRRLPTRPKKTVITKTASHHPAKAVPNTAIPSRGMTIVASVTPARTNEVVHFCCVLVHARRTN